MATECLGLRTLPITDLHGDISTSTHTKSRISTTVYSASLAPITTGCPRYNDLMPNGLCLSVCGTWYYCYLLGFVFLFFFFFISYFAGVFWQSRLEGIQAGQKHFTLAADWTITDNMPTEGIHSHKIIHHSKTDPKRWLPLPSVACYHQFKTFPVSVSLDLKSKSFALCLCIKCCLSCYLQPMTCCHLFFFW